MTRLRSLALLLTLSLVACGQGPQSEAELDGTANTDESELILSTDWVSATNAVRATVHLPSPWTPLPNVTWNKQLASIAYRWATSCQAAHSPNSYRTNVAGFAYVGENIAWGTPSASSTASLWVNNWAAQQQYFTYPTTCAVGQSCNAYTQLVWRTSTQIGCAEYACPAGTLHATMPRTNVVCWYGPGGNLQGQAPY